MSTSDQTAVVPTSTATSGATRPAGAGPLAAAIADAALAVDGVHHLGTAAGRVIASIRTAAAGRQFAPGVRIDQITGGVQVDVVAEYPVNVIEVADRVRAAVGAVPGVDGPRVDVIVTDVHGPFDRDQPVGDPLAGAKAGMDEVIGSAKSAATTAADAARSGAGALADGSRETADAVSDGAKTGARVVADGAQDAAGAVGDAAAVVAERAKAVADAVQAESERGDARTERTTTVTPDTVVVVVEPERVEVDGERRTDRGEERTDGQR